MVALHALAQLEGPFLAIGRGGPALGDIRLDMVRRGLTRLDAHQAVEHPVHQRLAGRAGIEMRIEHARILRLHADDQRGFLRQRGPRAQESRDRAPQKP